MMKNKNIIIVGSCIASEIVRKSLQTNDTVLLVEAKENEAFKPEHIPYVINSVHSNENTYIHIKPKSNFIDGKTLNKRKPYKTKNHVTR